VNNDELEAFASKASGAMGPRTTGWNLRKKLLEVKFIKEG